MQGGAARTLLLDTCPAKRLNNGATLCRAKRPQHSFSSAPRGAAPLEPKLKLMPAAGPKAEDGRASGGVLGGVEYRSFAETPMVGGDDSEGIWVKGFPALLAGLYGPSGMLECSARGGWGVFPVLVVEIPKEFLVNGFPVLLTGLYGGQS